MAIHNKSHNNHTFTSLNKMHKNSSLKHKSASDFEVPNEIKLHHRIADCYKFLKKLPNNSIQLICIDPQYNLELAEWDIYDDYIQWDSK